MIILISVISLFSSHSEAQVVAPDTTDVYRVNRWVEIPLTIGLFAGYQYGLGRVYDKPTLDSIEISSLNPSDIWRFDRSATRQDAAFRHEAHRISDNVMKVTVALPFLLLLDNEIRKEWVDFLVLYGQAHSISGLTYVLTTAAYDRNRPLAYSSEIPLSDKMGTGTRNSFFSGHTSTTATASFFMAKVYSDFHPEIGNSKYLLYAAALIPPAVVGLYRYKAMKHYPTDVLMGVAVGAASGILVPHFHKKRKKMKNFSFVPYGGEVSGLYISYRIAPSVKRPPVKNW